MIDGVLKQVTGFFDPRALLSTFFPSLIGWALVAAVVALPALDLRAAGDRWDGLKPSAQAGAIVLFVAWVVFWTLLIVNIRPTFIRLFEGYWDGYPGLRRLIEPLRGRLRTRRDAMSDEDAGLAERAKALIFEPDTPAAAPPTPPELLAWAGALERRDQLGQAPDFDVLLALRAAVRQLSADRSADDARVRIDTLTRRELDRIQRRRNVLNQVLSTNFPTGDAELLPTRLGNVIRAAELYGGERYGLDAVTVWPRLFVSMPGHFRDAFRDVRASLDFMVTQSVFFAGFGLTLAGIVIWRGLPVAGTVVAAIALLLSAVAYRSAVQSAVGYGALIKTGLDLHRWLVLDDLHLQRPTTYDDERKLWDAVCRLLARAAPPDPRYYRYVKDAATLEGETPTVSLPVPSVDLLPYQMIGEADLTEGSLPTSAVPPGAARAAADVVGRCSLLLAAAGQPLRCSQLVEPAALLEMVAMSVRVAAGAGLDGGLDVGDLVDAFVFTPNAADHAPLRFEELRVLRLTPLDRGASAVTLAVPRNQREDFASGSASGRVVLSRRLGS